MLGLYPIGSRSISAGPFSLVAIPAALVATLTLTFAVPSRIGANTPLRSTVGISFGLVPNLAMRQVVAATTSISFNGSSRLFVAGKSIQINALPASYTLRAMPDSYALKAMAASFTIRGVR